MIISAISLVGVYVFKQRPSPVESGSPYKLEQSILNDSKNVLSISPRYENDTLGWNNYRNTEQGLHFDYPKGWGIQDSGLTIKQPINASVSTKPSEFQYATFGRITLSSPALNIRKGEHHEDILEGGARIELVYAPRSENKNWPVEDCKGQRDQSRLIGQLKIYEQIGCLYQYSSRHYNYDFITQYQTPKFELIIGEKVDGALSREIQAIYHDIARSMVML